MSIAARRMQRGSNKVVSPIYKFGFESGTSGMAVSTAVTAAGDTPWGGVGIGSGATLTNDTAHVMHGSMAAKLVASASTTSLRWNTAPALSGAFRYYIWRSNYPASDTSNFWIGSDSSTKICNTVISSTGALRLYSPAAVPSIYSTTDSAIPLNTWVRIEVAYVVDPSNSANGRIRVALYSGESTSAVADSGWITSEIGTAGATFVRVGKYDSGNDTSTSWFDSITFDPTAVNLLGPVGGGGGNAAPVAEAGSAQSVTTGDTVTLNGSGSTDSDGTIVSYAWSQVSGTSVTLSSTSAQQPTFVAPGSAGTLVFSLTVTDNDGATGTDTVTITVGSAVTGTPIDDAGSLALGATSYSIPGSNVIYLSTTGNDSNAGTLAAPKRTLASAVSAVPTGGTIVVRAGSYNDGEDTQDQAYPLGVTITKNVTIQNYPGEVVWFDGSTPVTGSWTQSGSRWNTPYDRLFNRSPTSADGQDDGWGASSGAGGWFTHPDRPQASYPDMVFYDGVQMEQVATLAEVTTGKFFIEGATTTGKWFQGTKLHIGSNPVGHEIRYANKCKFATFAGSSNTSTLRGIGIRRYASYICSYGCMYVQHSLTVENVIVEDIRCGFVHHDGSDAANYTKVTARRIGFNFIGSNMADHFMIDRADMQQCNYAGWNIYGPSIGTIKLNKCQYVTIKNSIMKDTDGSGFWCDSTCNTPIIVNSLFQNISNRPIDYETASDGIIANCKFISNGADTIFINDSDTTRIYNCVLAENQWGYRGTGGARGISTSQNVSPVSVGQSRRRYDNSDYSFNYDSRLGASYYTAYPQHQWTINYVTMCNTVIARPGSHTYCMWSAGNGGDNFREAGRTFVNNMHPTMNGNIYHWVTQPQYPWIAAKGYNVNPDVSFNLSSWRTLTGQEASSSFTNTDPLNGNYQVTNTTYHNSAVGLPSDIAALIGQPAGTKHAGAFW